MSDKPKTQAHQRPEGEASGEARFEQQGRPDLSGPWTLDAFQQVLKKLEGARTVAYFLVSDGLSEKCVFFPAGGLRVTSIGARAGRSVPQVIRARPDFQPGWEKALAEAQGDSERALEDLASGELREAMKESAREVIRDELLDLLVWEGADFEFRLTNPPPAIFAPGMEAAKLSLGVRALLEEVGKQAGEWRRLSAKLGGTSRTQVTLVGRPPAKTPGLRGAYACLAKSPDQRATLDEVLIAGRRGGAADALALAGELLAQGEVGALQIDVAPPPLPREARRRQAQQRVDALEAALDKLINQLAARRRLAAEYGELGDQDRAVENLRVVGEELRRREDLEGALGVYQQILGFSPQAFFAREELAALFTKLKRGPEAIAQWLRLAKDLAKFRLFNRAQRPLREAIKGRPDDPDLRRYLIESLEASGDEAGAAQEWGQLAQLYQGQGQADAALACYQQLALKDPRNEAAQKALGAASKGRVSLGGVLLILLLLGGLLGGAGYVYLRFQTLQAFQAAREAARKDAFLGKFAEARGRMTEFRAGHDYPPERVDAVLQVIGELEEAEAGQALRQAQGREARGRQDEALSLYKAIEGGYPETKASAAAQARAEALGAEVRRAELEASEVNRLAEAGEVGAAFAKGRALIKALPWTPAARALELPVRVETQPEGARVQVGGETLEGRTPLVVRHAWGEPFTVSVSAAGHQQVSLELDLQAEGAEGLCRLVLPREVRWRRVTGGPIVAAPSVSGGVVVTVSSDQTLYAYDRGGRLRWRYPQGELPQRLEILSGVRSAPLVSTRAVFVSERQGVRVLSAEDGALVGLVGLETESRPLGLAGELAIFASAREVLALDAQGQERWRRELPGRLAGGSVDAAKGRVLVTTTSAQLLVMEAESGKLFRPMALGGRPRTAPVAVSGGALVAREGALLELVWDQVRWSVALPREASADPVTEGELAFLACGDTLVAFALADGQERWRRVFKGSLGQPVVAEGRVYVGTSEGELWALGCAEGKVRWELPGTGPLLAPPVIDEDLIFLGSGDFKLYAIPDR